MSDLTKRITRLLREANPEDKASIKEALRAVMAELPATSSATKTAIIKATEVKPG
jgi:hypothetical protein